MSTFKPAPDTKAKLDALPPPDPTLAHFLHAAAIQASIGVNRVPGSVHNGQKFLTRHENGRKVHTYADGTEVRFPKAGDAKATGMWRPS